MKRTMSIVMALVLMASFTACSGKSVKPTGTSATDTAKETAVTHLTAATEEATAAPTSAPTTKSSATPTKVPVTSSATQPTKAPTTSTATKCAHNNTEWVIDKAGTCIAEGEKHKVCADCKAVLEKTTTERAEHSYRSYKCTVCGEFQEGGLSRYLSDWVQKNGKANGDTVSLDFYIDDVLYGFTYNATGDYIYFSLLDENYNDFLSMKFTEETGVYELAYIQGTEPNTREVYGKINAAAFTENTPVTVEKYLGNSDGRPGAVENCRICTCLLLESIDVALAQYNIGLSLKDLGFSAFR